MKIYLSCDMEGTAGVTSWAQCDPGNVHEYPVCRRYMTREVRAAVAGAFTGGADEILVNDSHWEMRNVLLDELPDDPRVRVVTGSPKPLSMGQALDASCDAVFFTGYHAKAGDVAALSHTFSNSTIYSVSINGTHCSEALLYAAYAGSFGVPVVLVTGDTTIVEETTRALPWAVGVAVKQSIGYFAAASLMPAAACAAIEAGAREAVTRIDKAKPFVFDSPFQLVVETMGVEHADFIELLPGFSRIGGRAVGFTANDYPATLRAFIVAARLGGAANAVA